MRVSAVLVVGLLALTAGCGRAAPPETHAPSQHTDGDEDDRRACAAGRQDRRAVSRCGRSSYVHRRRARLDGGDLILTAAHCVAGGVDTTFVAGFSGAADRREIWRVDSIYLDPRWVRARIRWRTSQFCVWRATVAARIEAEAGGGLSIGTAPKPGTMVNVTGYGLGVGGGPIGCTGTTELAPGGFPSLSCGGLIDGTSGAPWTTGPTITGLVGGLDGGGCDENVSYSPPFDDGVVALLARAEAGGPGDEAPDGVRRRLLTPTCGTG